MKLYKTCRFKDIEEVEVISFDDKTFKIMASDYRPKQSYWKDNDKVRTINRFSACNNYHSSIEEAKNFMVNLLENKINKLTEDLIKYNETIKKFQ